MSVGALQTSRPATGWALLRYTCGECRYFPHVRGHGARADQIRRRPALALDWDWSRSPTPTTHPEKIDAAQHSPPISDLISVATGRPAHGGIHAVAGIHLSDVTTLNDEKELFYERELRRVPANTRPDGQDSVESASYVAEQLDIADSL